MSKRLVHVARDGKVLGQYPPEQLAALIDTGHFLDSDLCYSENHPIWTPMPQFLKKIEAPKYSRAHKDDSHASEVGYSRRGHRSKRNLPVVLSGWIAFLLALSALLGAGFWIAGLYAEIGRQASQVAEMDKTLVQKEKENQRLLFISREVAESGTVRGSIVIRNEAGKRVAMPGVQVFLFPRKTIESYLEARAADVARIPAGTTVDGNEFFTASLPSSAASTTTDASGRFEFSVPDPGEYVLFTRMNSFAQGAQVAKIWFVGFNSQDPLNTLVQITEANSVQQFVPSLMIVEGR
ncbi:MAG: hypothetical protein NTV93_01555 [Verrucomicrobia bacterium]|nr:hypothetical protein [Verrucomicrobiota bacterium]